MNTFDIKKRIHKKNPSKYLEGFFLCILWDLIGVKVRTRIYLNNLREYPVKFSLGHLSTTVVTFSDSIDLEY
jgi:hypothetical protein